MPSGSFCMCNLTHPRSSPHPPSSRIPPHRLILSPPPQGIGSLAPCSERCWLALPSPDAAGAVRVHDLAAAGSRWTEGQLRLRMVDASRINPETIMPAYFRTEGLTRVARNFAGKPILTAEQVEDVVAFLATLR